MASDVSASSSSAPSDERTYKGWDVIRFMPKDVISRMIQFTIAMFLVPLGSYFGARDLLFEGFLGYDNGSVPASIVAVVMVQVVLGVCVWIAYSEGDESSAAPSDDSRKRK
eukprot:Opistho-2@73768